MSSVVTDAETEAPGHWCHAHTCTWEAPPGGRLWHLHRVEPRPPLAHLLAVVRTRFMLRDRMCITAPDLEVHAVIERISAGGAVIAGSTPEGHAVKLDLRQRQVTVRPRLSVG